MAPRPLKLSSIKWIYKIFFKKMLIPIDKVGYEDYNVDNKNLLTQ